MPRKYQLILSAILFAAPTLNAQKPFHLKKVNNANDNCIHKPKYSAAQRHLLYPFNVGDTIKLVSFRAHFNKYPFTGNDVLYDSIIETKTLSEPEKDSLSDITENNFRIKPDNIGHVNMCFFPRNAILFIDKAGKLRSYLLICFHCRSESMYTTDSSDKNWSISNCGQMFDMVRQFFIEKGLQFGTDLEKNDYPGETGGDELQEPPNLNLSKFDQATPNDSFRDLC